MASRPMREEEFVATAGSSLCSFYAGMSQFEMGGDRMYLPRLFECGSCGHFWEIPYGVPKPPRCSKCGSKDVLLGPSNGELYSEMLDPHAFS